MRYLPASSQGSVIITSQRSDINITGSLKVEVAPLDLITSAKLLNSLIQSPESDDSAREVADLLGGLPLAISQVGGHMKSTATTCSEYIQLYKKGELGLFDEPYLWKRSIFGTVLASLSADARKLIEYMALLDPDRIPEELFLQNLEDVSIVERYVVSSSLRLLSLNEYRFRISRAELLRLSLVRRETSHYPSYSIHRLLQSFILQDLIADPQKCLETFLKVLRLIRGVVPCLRPYMNREDIVLYQDLFKRYISHIRNLNEIHDRYSRFQDTLLRNLDFAQLLFDTVLYLIYFGPIGPNNLAQSLCEKAIEIRRFALGEKHADTLASQFSLVLILQRHRKRVEAKKLIKHLENVYMRSFGPKSLQMLTDELSFASMGVGRGDIWHAIPLFTPSTIQ